MVIRNGVVACGLLFVCVFTQACAQHRVTGASTKRAVASESPAAEPSSNPSASDQSYSGYATPTPDPFLNTYNQQSYNPYAAGQGQYSTGTNAGFDVTSLVGLFGSMMGSGGLLNKLFSGSNVANASSPAASCGASTNAGTGTNYQ
jgi:hypothetical protein